MGLLVRTSGLSGIIPKQPSEDQTSLHRPLAFRKDFAFKLQTTLLCNSLEFRSSAMTEPALTLIVLLFVVPVWSVSMWAMLMMVVGALKDERFTLFRLLTGYFLQEPYNRKYFRIFVTCVAALVGFGIIFNVLYVAGAIGP